MAQYDDLNTKQIWVVGLVSAVLTGITILAVQVLYFAMLESHEKNILAGSEYTTSTQHIEDQMEALSSYGRNPETGAVEIPLNQAMELLIDRSTNDAEQGASEEA